MQAVEKASKDLRQIIYPDDDDEIPNALKIVRMLVEGALEQDPKLKEHLASEEELCDNVTRKGEKNFIDSLRAMAVNCDSTQGSKAWENLFKDGTSFSLGPIVVIVFSVWRSFWRKCSDVDPSDEATASSEEGALKGEAATVLLSGMPGLINRLTGVIQNSMTTPDYRTTTRRAQAVQLVQQVDDGLSTTEKVELIRQFQENAVTADIYLSLTDRALRHAWIHMKLNS
jgi:hypothetical protein